MAPNEYLSDFFLKSEDLQLLQEIGQLVIPDLATTIADFYVWMKKSGLLREFFDDEEHIEHVQQQQVFYWKTFFSGIVDEKYIKSRKLVGSAHARIGLSLDSYYTSVVNFKDLFIKQLEKHNIATLSYISAFYKLLDLDVYLIVNAYHENIQHTIQEHNKTMMEMSTPIANIWDDILFLPIVGIVDSQRALNIMTQALDEISQKNAKVFMIDISGILVMDTAVANNIFKLVKATKLMGCTSILTGISSLVAQTLVDLGVNTDELITTNSLKDALQTAFTMIGR